MHPAEFGIVLRVRDLTKCRAFYRDVLDLGNPVIDSNFQSVFAIGEESSLCLEADTTAAALSGQDDARMALVLIPEDPEGVAERLESGGWTLRSRKEEHSSSGVLECRDPEGNRFYLQFS